jgi:hypothetical protein
MGRNIVDLGVETSIEQASLPRVRQNLETTKGRIVKTQIVCRPRSEKG